jgi:hypothetical protein
MRAEYADEIENKLMHPWPGLSDEEWLEAVRKLHVRIRSLIKPVADFLHRAEAAYIMSRPEGIVRIVRSWPRGMVVLGVPPTRCDAASGGPAPTHSTFVRRLCVGNRPRIAPHAPAGGPCLCRPRGSAARR